MIASAKKKLNTAINIASAVAPTVTAKVIIETTIVPKIPTNNNGPNSHKQYSSFLLENKIVPSNTSKKKTVIPIAVNNNVVISVKISVEKIENTIKAITILIIIEIIFKPAFL